MFFDTDAVCHGHWLSSGKDGRSGIAFFYRIIPVLMITFQFKADLPFLEFAFLNTEHIRIQLLKNI